MRYKYLVFPRLSRIGYTIQVGSDFIQHALGFSTTNTTILILFIPV